MTISDNRLVFASTQDIGSEAPGVVAMTDDYDSAPLFTGNAGVPWGDGSEIHGFIYVTEAPTTGTTAEIEIQIVSDADPGGQDVNSNVHWSSGPRDTSYFTLGMKIPFVLNPSNDSAPYLRYLGGVFTVTTGTLTAGIFTVVLNVFGNDTGQKAGDYASALNFN